MRHGSWLLLGMLGIACGGVVTRHGGDDDDDQPVGPTSNGGSTSKAGSAPAVGGSTTSRGGSANASAGMSTAGSTSVPPVNLGEGSACYNDVDCPNAACGGLVCNWTKQSAQPDGMKIFYCNAAGTQPKGTDGWCTVDTDCKCQGQGARCVGTYCSFTRSTDAP